MDLTASVASTATRIGLELGIPMADSVMPVTARTWNATLWRQDSGSVSIPRVRSVARRDADGVRVVMETGNRGWSRFSRDALEGVVGRAGRRGRAGQPSNYCMAVAWSFR